MVYKLDSEILRDYFDWRMDKSSRGFMQVTGTQEGIILNTTSERERKDIVIVPRFVSARPDRIEIEIEAEVALVSQKDTEYFLRGVLVDRFYQEPFPRGLGFPSILEQLSKWKETLERADKPEERKMVCRIINPKVNTKKLLETTYEYMGRLCLYYLFKVGKFYTGKD